jgi:N6-adenosine-specific RNA methylase IME4
MADETRYRTIVADPPWDYGEFAFAASPTSRKDNPRGSMGYAERRRLPYASLTVEEIAALPVGDLAAPDSALFLWTTNRHLPESFAVIRAWGFDYRQTLVWYKTGNPTPFGGSVAPNHAEFLLVGKRGRVSLGRLTSSVIAAPAANCGGHSAKPDCVLDAIERIAPGPYLELFARRARFGWDYYGDESLGTADLGGEAA